MYSLFSCEHRKDPIALTECTLCPSPEVEVPVYSCDIHGLCTIHRVTNDIKNCQKCPDRKWDEPVENDYIIPANEIIIAQAKTDAECCDVPIPDTLTATITDISGCSCLDGVELTLNHEVVSMTDVWYSDPQSLCGVSVELKLSCISYASNWLITLVCDSGLGDSQDFVVETSCNPFAISTNLDTSSLGNCGSCFGQLTVSITE